MSFAECEVTKKGEREREREKREGRNRLLSSAKTRSIAERISISRKYLSQGTKEHVPLGKFRQRDVGNKSLARENTFG